MEAEPVAVLPEQAVREELQPHGRYLALDHLERSWTDADDRRPASQRRRDGDLQVVPQDELNLVQISIL